MAVVVVSPLALIDLEDIAAYLMIEAGPSIANRYAEEFVEVMDQLALFPGSGSPRPGLGRDVRIAIVTPYLLIHRHALGSECIDVLRVVHGRRKITRRMLR